MTIEPSLRGMGLAMTARKNGVSSLSRRFHKARARVRSTVKGSIMIPLLVVTSFPIALASALADGLPQEILCFNLSRCLYDDQLAHYRQVERHIEGELSEIDAAQDVVDTATALRKEVEALDSLPAEALYWLDRWIGERALEGSGKSHSRLLAFLESGDAQLQGYALNYLLNFGLDGRDELRSLLQGLVADRRADPETRAQALWVLQFHGALEVVVPHALSIACSDQSEAAHAAASVLITDASGDEDEIAGYLGSGCDALEFEAARWLAEESPEGSEGERAVSLLSRVAGDRTVSPTVRGQAIESIGAWPKREQNQRALLDLASPSNWFFGAEGNHFRVHSLALIIDALSRVEAAEVERRLADLSAQTPLLRTGEREYVEWRLRSALGQGRKAPPNHLSARK